MKEKIGWIWSFTIAALICCMPAFGQMTSGNLVGAVFDPTGSTVAHATVTATEVATNVESTTQTTSAGQYRFSNLPSGTYKVTAEAAGFSKAAIDGVGVVLNNTVTQNFNLQLNSASTTVEVTEAAVAIDTTTPQIQTSFDAKQLADLPSASGGQNGTGVLNVSLLAPNVTTSGGLGYGEGPSVGGQRPTNNNFMVEGIDNNALGVTGPIVSVPNDAVSEFTMLQNQFSPDFGHSSGGQFNEIVKSGTNEFHGALYEYFQNRNLDAGDSLSAVQGTPLHPRFDENRFGGTFGGPIKRNKLFFFFNYEFNPIGQTASTAYYAPTDAGYAALAGVPGISANNLSIFKKYLGSAGTAADPAGLPFGGPVAVGGVTVPVGQVSASLPNYINYENAVASVDYNISSKDSLRGRFILNRDGSIDTNGFPSQFFTVTPNNAYLATLSEYHTFSPTVTNEFRLGYNRLFQQFPIAAKETFPGLDQFPNLVVYELNASIGPDPNAPQYTIQNLYQGTDNLSWVFGQHSLKFGSDVWSTISPTKFIQRSRGDYQWNNFSDYLMDNTPDVIAQRSLGDTGYYQNDQLYSFYGADSWKVNSHLTIDLGLRYEYMTIPLGQKAQALNASANVPGLISFGVPKAQKTNFMPRVGLAYSPGTSGKTSFRMGFGEYYDVLYQNLGSLSLPPQLTTTADVTGNGGTGFLAGGGIVPNTSVAIPQGADARAGTSGYIPDQKRPESYSWNAGIQHEFAGHYIFQSLYLGTRGLYLPVQVQLNRVPVVNSSNALPVYLTAPSQATLDTLSNSLGALNKVFKAQGNVSPAYLAAGFVAPITAFMPIGNSVYHSWSNDLTRSFSNGLQFDVNYTWSHNIDDSTAAVNSTVISPRRPQDFTNLRSERASSILDHRNRVIAQVLYDLPYFKHSNWLLKNLVGNWEIAPVYTYQTGQHATAQSGTDTNLNGDSAPDRVVINPGGNQAAGSDTTPLTNSNGATVAYLANNPNAAYINAPKGVFATGGRNTLMLNPIDDIDLTLLKRISITERYKFEISARAFNIFNHPQYVGGYVNDVFPIQGFAAGGSQGVIIRPALQPNSPTFQQWSQVVSSNPRAIQLAVKFSF